MNSDLAPDELAARISSISVRVPEDRIDLDEAVRAGTKRRWHQRLAVAGAFGCVAAATASAFLLSPATPPPAAQGKTPPPAAQGRALPPATPGKSTATTMPDAQRSTLPAARLDGRWLATSIDGQDVSSWRDPHGLPANIIFGADDSPGRWQMQGDCGPLIQDDFALRKDGSFSEAALPPPASCPAERVSSPDLGLAIARTAFVTVEQASKSPFRTMLLLDRHRKVVARLREDTRIASPTPICVKALGSGATADGTFTTVERIRNDKLAATTVPDEVLPGVSFGDVAVYCHAAGANASVRYAVTAGGQMVKLR